MLVAVDNLQGYVHQLHLEGNIGLVSLADNPLVAVDVHDVVRGQVLHVNEREGGEADKYKNVTNEGQIVVLELMGYDSLQFVLGQEFPFLAVGADVELRERVLAGASVPRAERRGILPLQCALRTTPFSHMHRCQIVPLVSPWFVLR